jgi:hypothetical protein
VPAMDLDELCEVMYDRIAPEKQSTPHSIVRAAQMLIALQAATRCSDPRPVWWSRARGDLVASEAQLHQYVESLVEVLGPHEAQDQARRVGFRWS